MPADFTIYSDQSISILYPKSETAREWMDEHVETGPVFGDGYAVENRYLADLMHGISSAGMVALLTGV